MTSPIAGAVLPIKRAEDLILTLPGVVSAKILAGDNGTIDQIHVLVSGELTPKQIVRNIESALVAHLSMRIDHRKISVATTTEPKQKRSRDDSGNGGDGGGARPGGGKLFGTGRRLYFEDVEVRGSRSKGVSCRVTLRKGDASWTGEAQGIEGDRSRLDLAARATVLAIAAAEGKEGQLAVEGVKVVEAFDRRYVFLAVTIRSGRDAKLLAGTCEITESAETASVLAVLNATNRWVDQEAE
ncbi:MAG: hypothetical protein H0W69_11120 [Gemmatimonadaceae bacterium]|nr:hypothetical protein [Gemmatimonadaceae bacterium]